MSYNRLRPLPFPRLLISWMTSSSVVRILGPHSEHKSKDGCQDIDPYGHPIMRRRQTNPFSIITSRNLQEFEGIVGNHSIDIFRHTPLHPLFVVDCPQKYRASGSADIAEEFTAEGSHHAFLEHVKVHSIFF